MTKEHCRLVSKSNTVDLKLEDELRFYLISELGGGYEEVCILKVEIYHLIFEGGVWLG